MRIEKDRDGQWLVRGQSRRYKTMTEAVEAVRKQGGVVFKYDLVPDGGITVVMARANG